MSKKKKVDEVLSELYTGADNWNDRLNVAKEMVKLEMARLKGDNLGGGDTPEGLRDE